MVIIAYLLPLMACLVIGLCSDWRVDGAAYFWMILLGDGGTAALHYFFWHKRTHVVEYLGSIVTRIVHEDAWTELTRRKVQKTDSAGRSYTVEVIDETYHPEEYSFHTSLGHHFKTNVDFFFHVFARWDEPHKVRVVTGSHIKSGRRNIEYKSFDDELVNCPEHNRKFIPISEKHYYKNKIRNSNSIFNHTLISREEARSLGLYEWPDTDAYYDAPAILADGMSIPEDTDQEFRRFNALVASKKEMRLFVLLFPAAKGLEIAEKQRDYWKGGNKNEFVVCLGVDGKRRVDWCHCFSWADENRVEVATAEWFRHHPQLDFHEFLRWFETAHLEWKRKEFKDFNYISVRLELWQQLCILGASALMAGIISAVALSQLK